MKTKGQIATTEIADSQSFEYRREPILIGNLKNAWDSEERKFKIEIPIFEPLKWGRQQMHFSAVFSGSNDRGNVSRAATIESYLLEVSRYSPISLVSVIGGAYFLDLLDKVPFARTILFDSNVAEIAKIGTALNCLSVESSRNPFETVEALLEKDPELLLPRLSNHHIRWSIDASVEWEFEGVKTTAFPVVISSRDYPQYQWNTSQDGRERVLHRLRDSLVKSVFPSLPYLDAERHLVVVFCSNARLDQLSESAILGRIKNACGVIILRSEVSTNEEALDPHPYWEAVAQGLLQGKSHQVWAPENANLVGSSYDKLTDSSGLLGEAIPSGAETVLFHIVLGKTATNVRTRKIEFRKCLSSIPETVSKIVVAEYRPETGLGRSGFSTMRELANFASESTPSFEFVETHYAPGLEDQQRNAFLVFMRRK